MGVSKTSVVGTLVDSSINERGEVLLLTEFRGYVISQPEKEDEPLYTVTLPTVEPSASLTKYESSVSVKRAWWLPSTAARCRVLLLTDRLEWVVLHREAGSLHWVQGPLLSSGLARFYREHEHLDPGDLVDIFSTGIIERTDKCKDSRELAQPAAAKREVAQPAVTKCCIIDDNAMPLKYSTGTRRFNHETQRSAGGKIQIRKKKRKRRTSEGNKENRVYEVYFKQEPPDTPAAVVKQITKTSSTGTKRLVTYVLDGKQREEEIGNAAADKEENVLCVCGATEEDSSEDEEWVECELCHVWQHVECVAYYPEVQDYFHCDKCLMKDTTKAKLPYSGKKRGRKPKILLETEGADSLVADDSVNKPADSSAPSAANITTSSSRAAANITTSSSRAAANITTSSSRAGVGRPRTPSQGRGGNITHPGGGRGGKRGRPRKSANISKLSLVGSVTMCTTRTASNSESGASDPDEGEKSSDSSYDISHHGNHINCPCGASESESGEEWVQCDECDKWQHQDCVNYSAEDKINYQCPSCRQIVSFFALKTGPPSFITQRTAAPLQALNTKTTVPSSVASEKPGLPSLAVLQSRYEEAKRQTLRDAPRGGTSHAPRDGTSHAPRDGTSDAPRDGTRMGSSNCVAMSRHTAAQNTRPRSTTLQPVYIPKSIGQQRFVEYCAARPRSSTLPTAGHIRKGDSIVNHLDRNENEKQQNNDENGENNRPIPENNNENHENGNENHGNNNESNNENNNENNNESPDNDENIEIKEEEIKEEESVFYLGAGDQFYFLFLVFTKYIVILRSSLKCSGEEGAGHSSDHGSGDYCVASYYEYPDRDVAAFDVIANNNATEYSVALVDYNSADVIVWKLGLYCGTKRPAGPHFTSPTLQLINQAVVLLEGDICVDRVKWLDQLTLLVNRQQTLYCLTTDGVRLWQVQHGIPFLNDWLVSEDVISLVGCETVRIRASSGAKIDTEEEAGEEDFVDKQEMVVSTLVSPSRLLKIQLRRKLGTLQHGDITTVHIFPSSSLLPHTSPSSSLLPHTSPSSSLLPHTTRNQSREEQSLAATSNKNSRDITQPSRDITQPSRDITQPSRDVTQPSHTCPICSTSPLSPVSEHLVTCPAGHQLPLVGGQVVDPFCLPEL